MSVGERLCSRVSDRPAPPLAAFGRQGQIIAHFLGRSYDLHIYYGIFCTGCPVVSDGKSIDAWMTAIGYPSFKGYHR